MGNVAVSPFSTATVMQMLRFRIGEGEPLELSINAGGENALLTPGMYSTSGEVTDMPMVRR